MKQYAKKQDRRRTARASWTRRAVVSVVAAASVTSVAVNVVPSANASVYQTCTMTKCADGSKAASIWASKGWPSNSGWYAWPDGRYNYTGGVFQNREGQLPSGVTYHEYDVYSRAKYASRDAYRIVHSSTGKVYFSPDHYANFYLLSQ
ncbi:ribonuclease domain-containing protein [Actinomadura oligospora]|uniref:ribonuclease domain-containing protein n=1 Tax=Actinomadura oligospora TaxID=111804 RepID=UPI0004798D4F|nr:ribonuclease domain-containing protein [Actinomadura oligospora]